MIHHWDIVDITVGLLLIAFAFGLGVFLAMESGWTTSSVTYHTLDDGTRCVKIDGSLSCAYKMECPGP